MYLACLVFQFLLFELSFAVSNPFHPDYPKTRSNPLASYMKFKHIVRFLIEKSHSRKMGCRFQAVSRFGLADIRQPATLGTWPPKCSRTTNDRFHNPFFTLGSIAQGCGLILSKGVVKAHSLTRHQITHL